MLETLLNLDGGFLLFLQESVRNPILNSMMVFITSLGNGGMIWIVATILLLIPKKTRKVGIMSAVALLGSLIINNNIIKNLVRRPRPFVKFTDLQIIIPTPQNFLSHPDTQQALLRQHPFFTDICQRSLEFHPLCWQA